MRLLIDTHALIWFCDGSASLSAAARAAMEEPGADRLDRTDRQLRDRVDRHFLAIDQDRAGDGPAFAQDLVDKHGERRAEDQRGGEAERERGGYGVTPQDKLVYSGVNLDTGEAYFGNYFPPGNNFTPPYDTNVVVNPDLVNNVEKQKKNMKKGT